MIAPDDSVLHSLVLSPKAMGLMIMHWRLARLPGHDPEAYTSLFPVEQIIDSNGKEFCSNWTKLLPPIFAVSYMLLVQT